MIEVKKLIAEARGYQGQDEYGLVDLAHRLADALEAIDSAPVVARPLPNREAVARAIHGATLDFYGGMPRQEFEDVREYDQRGYLSMADAVLAAIETAPVVSDDTEWEYRCNFPGLGWVACPDGRDCIYPSRRRSVGPWVAVEKGGESNE